MAKRKKSAPSGKGDRKPAPKKGPAGDAEIIPPDQAQRDAIVTRLDTTMLVEAPAGSGKTRSMVDRMIALLREGKCRIETLAAITFTRKAAAELRARFQVALEKATREATGAARERLAEALGHAERVFIGTIHSFCGRLLRERPVEAGIEPSFQELDEVVDARLQREAWGQCVADLIATGNPILGELEELGLGVGELDSAFRSYATYPDVDEWPCEEVGLPDLEPARKELRSYAAHMESLIPTLPDDAGNDTLIPKHRRVARLVRQADLHRPAELMEVLAEFGNARIVQKMWPGKKAQALAEKERWDHFKENIAEPLTNLWLEARYPVVLRVLAEAVKVYDRLRRDAGGMNYQ